MSDRVSTSLYLVAWLAKGLARHLVEQAPRVLRPLKAFLPSYFTGYGSLAVFKRLPTEIFQEILVHTCGDEYIAFFNHFALPLGKDATFPETSDISRMNTAYVLKAVCKEWKDLVEGTPSLWQRVYFDFDDFWIERGQFRSVQHFHNMMTRVLLPRSAGLGLHIKIRGQTYSRENLDVRSRMRYFEPLLLILAEEGHRWSSADFYSIESRTVDDTNSVVHPTLAFIMANTSFPQLRRFVYHAAKTSCAPLRLDFSSSAPRLTDLTIHGEDFRRLGGQSASFRCQWGNVTSLVIDLVTFTNLQPGLQDLIPVLQGVRFSLVSLNFRGAGVYSIGDTAQYPHSDGPLIEFERLRDFTVEDTQALHLCHALLSRISCTTLRTFQVLLGSRLGFSHPGDPPWTDPLPGRLQILRRFLGRAPLLQTFTVLQVPHLSPSEMKEKPRGKDKHINYGYLVIGGLAEELRGTIQSCLAVESPGPPLAEQLSHNSHTLKQGVFSKVLRFVPWTVYSHIPLIRRMTERPRLMPPRRMTAWEGGQWSEKHHVEVGRSQRLLRFAHDLPLKYTTEEPERGDPESKLCALAELGNASTIILAHLLDMMWKPDNIYLHTVPDTCTISFCVAL